MEVDVIDQKLNAILGVEPTENQNQEIETIEEVSNLPSEIVSDNLPQCEVVDNDTEFNEDFEFARNNMKEISDMGMKAIKELSMVARDSQTPRIYEVLSGMLKNVSDINATIIDNHSKKIAQQPVEESNPIKVNSVENAIFCTSADVLKKLKSHNK